MYGKNIGIYGKNGRPVIDLIVKSLSDSRCDFEVLNGNLFTPDQFDKRFDVVITHGLRRSFGVVRDTYRSKGVPVVICDSPHFRIDGHHRMSVLSHDWSPPVRSAGKRLHRLSGSPAPFGDRGNQILILGQVSADSQHGKNDNELRVFYQKLIDDLYRLSNRPLAWRSHPEYPMDLGGACRAAKPSEETLEESLSRAWAVVTYNSTAGIEALLRGVPVYSFGPSPYRSLSSFNLEGIDDCRAPDRDSVLTELGSLAYTQWDASEILSGRALQFVFDCIDGKVPKVDSGDAYVEPQEEEEAQEQVAPVTEQAATASPPTPAKRGRPRKAPAKARAKRSSS